MNETERVSWWRRLLLRGLPAGTPLAPLAVLFGLNAVDEFDRAAFNVLLPEIKDSFGLDVQGALNLVGGVLLIAVLGQVVIGYYADRVSRVRFLVAGAAVWALFCFLTGLAPTVAVLALARAGSGLGKAVNEPTHRSLLADYYEPELRPAVFGLHSMANPVGLALGPLVGGLLAYFFDWRLPFIVFTVPTVVLLVLALRYLHDPSRGAIERRRAGADDAVAETEEEPPSFREGWRSCYRIRSVRRMLWAFPFIGASLLAITTLYGIFYEEVFGLDEAQRGLVLGIVEPFGLVGLLAGIPLATRLARRDPALILKAIAVVGVVVSGLIVVLASAPVLAVAVVAHLLISAVLSALAPGILSVLSMVLPPNARAQGFGMAALFVVPGLLVLPLIGAISDAFGIRGGMLVMVPVFLLGSAVWATSGRYLSEDMTRVAALSLARAKARLGIDDSGPPPLLTVRGVDVAYGQTQVLFGVDLDVHDGEILALLGTNGAGKSTLMKAINGSVTPKAGAVLFEGRDITGQAANVAAAHGIVTVPGGKAVFPSLTVKENLELAAWPIRREHAAVRTAIQGVLDRFPVLRERWDQQAGNLSGGEQQMLALGQALLLRPRMLLIDELSLGLAPRIVEQLLGVVRDIHAQGATIVLVEQSVNVALTLAERAVFMEKGEVRFDGRTVELLHRPDILRSVFLEGATAAGNGSADGSAPLRVRDRTANGNGNGSSSTRALRVENLSVSFGGIQAVGDVSFELAEHEVLGIIGPNGAGKTTVFDLISGFTAPDTGRVLLGDTDVTSASPDARARLGLGRSFQDARLFPSMTVARAVAVALERHLDTRDPVAAVLCSPDVREAEEHIRARVDELLTLLNLTAFANKFVSELSTGSRRIVDLACSLAHEPTVLLLDEPSSGIAQRETEALGPLLLDIAAKTGAALLVIEHDMPLITSISDRLVALETGTVIAEGRPQDVLRDPTVVASYLGTTEEVIARSGTGRRRRARVRSNAGGVG